MKFIEAVAARDIAQKVIKERTNKELEPFLETIASAIFEAAAEGKMELELPPISKSWVPEVVAFLTNRGYNCIVRDSFFLIRW